MVTCVEQSVELIAQPLYRDASALGLVVLNSKRRKRLGMGNAIADFVCCAKRFKAFLAKISGAGSAMCFREQFESCFEIVSETG